MNNKTRFIDQEWFPLAAFFIFLGIVACVGMTTEVIKVYFTSQEKIQIEQINVEREQAGLPRIEINK